MTIISKFKDYYDYLTGMWGIDPKAILDRSRYTKTPDIIHEGDCVRFFICGFRVDGYFKEGRWHYGEDLYKFEREYKFSRWLHNIRSGDGEIGSRTVSVPAYKDRFSPRQEYHTLNVDIVRYPYLRCPNEKENTAILIQKGSKYFPNPILKDYNMGSLLPPESIYLMLTDWLLREVEVPNTQTNKEKILAHGFDYKTSFRKM